MSAVPSARPVGSNWSSKDVSASQPVVDLLRGGLVVHLVARVQVGLEGRAQVGLGQQRELGGRVVEDGERRRTRGERRRVVAGDGLVGLAVAPVAGRLVTARGQERGCEQQGGEGTAQSRGHTGTTHGASVEDPSGADQHRADSGVPRTGGSSAPTVIVGTTSGGPYGGELRDGSVTAPPRAKPHACPSSARPRRDGSRPSSAPRTRWTTSTRAPGRSSRTSSGRAGATGTSTTSSSGRRASTSSTPRPGPATSASTATGSATRATPRTRWWPR